MTTPARESPRDSSSGASDEEPELSGDDLGEAQGDLDLIPDDMAHGRARLLLLIAGTGWLVYGGQYLVSGRWPGVFHIGVALLTFALRSRLTATAPIVPIVHLAAAVSTVGLVGLGLFTGQELSPANWFFAGIPVFAIYALSVRAMVAWLCVAGVGLCAVHASALFVQIAPLVKIPSYEMLVAQLALGALLLAAAVAARVTNDRHLAKLTQRRKVVRAQAARIAAQSRELSRARDAALDAARVKSEFLATMSHEIRTPLNAVIGLTTLLSDADMPPEQRERIDAIRMAGESLLALVSDILDFSKIDAGKLEVESRPVDVARAIEDALDQIALGAIAKALVLDYEIASDCPATVMTDPTRVRQILVNLLGNAVKFTAGGSVTVHASASRDPEHGDALAFAVKDTGPGIAPDRLERLFKPFSQADASTTRKYGGTGLGLAISAELCELLGGTISVDSVPGQGSTFRFTITAPPALGRAPQVAASLRGAPVLVVSGHPVARDLLEKHVARLGLVPASVVSCGAGAARLAGSAEVECALVDLAFERDAPGALRELRAVRPSLPVVVIVPAGVSLSAELAGGVRLLAPLTRPLKVERLRDALQAMLTGEPVPTRRSAASFAPPSTFLPAATAAARAVLVVDDNALNRMVAVEMVRRLGFTAHEAAGGAHAIEAVRETRFAAVLMDIQMPEMDGYEATRRILAEARPGTPRPRIIAMTANALPGDRERCLDAGMSDYVSKPVRPNALAAALGVVAAPGALEQEPSAITDILDVQVLEDLRMLEATSGTPLLEELAGTYRADVPLRIEDLRAALRGGDRDTVKSLAHRLRGSASAIGAGRVFLTATEIEAAADSANLADVEPIIDLLEKESARALDALERTIQRARRAVSASDAGPAADA